ncbi:hypothetical protein DPMN_192525 [Dreissena polymorpha]|uniref:Uncharacterized protein n=1 Tax=Dreissena polymorpha TaxID=45954 RepID=A0A9D4BFR5_DREPO|nr:hypothetical protein DPMN_192525 [Dreissena polymorpha]
MQFIHKRLFFLGEHIGVDYLLNQTGNALQYASFIEKCEEIEILDLPNDTEKVTDDQTLEAFTAVPFLEEDHRPLGDKALTAYFL